MKKLKVALLYGGTSSERDISLNSGKNVGEALSETGHNIDYLDTKDKNNLIKLIDKDYDVAFLCLHGKGGEDGQIQGFLETIGLPYTCSGLLSSALAINKAITKNIYKENNIPTPVYVNLYKKMQVNIDDIIKTTGDHVVVKAAKEGSSIGLYIVKGKEEITEAINKAFKYDDVVVVEKFIEGKEYTVAVIQKDGEEQALPVIEIIPKNKFYDFASKYDEGGSQHICPAEIDETLTKNLQSIAKQAFTCLQCRGVARTDFIVDDQNQAWALETNTLPGMTRMSLVPDAARAVGLNFSELCNIILENALI
ncbi:MAG: D-alanine--D-alanine ligase [Coriobacteriia bacterium]|nr:D-alanine--D-alanine ligase [Coriobacteriia bacterium]